VCGYVAISPSWRRRKVGTRARQHEFVHVLCSYQSTIVPSFAGTPFALSSGRIDRVAGQGSTHMRELELQSATRWLRVIRAEYLEMPGLDLTTSQARRLWTLDESTCRALLDTLVSTKFLARTPRRTYVLATHV
jgi:hypothetical protein